MTDEDCAENERMCPVCGRIVRIIRAGVLRGHYATLGAEEHGSYCPGSFRRPIEIWSYLSVQLLSLLLSQTMTTTDDS